ncbi:hypothetical protein REPUB_Repub09cG0155700 [Reevesia pubescens]
MDPSNGNINQRVQFDLNEEAYDYDKIFEDVVDGIDQPNEVEAEEPIDITELHLQGMEFPLDDEALKFYRDYNHRVGFSIRIGISRRDKNSGLLIGRLSRAEGREMV